MADITNRTETRPQVTGPWRRSSFTDDQCVEVAAAGEKHVAVRNSRAHGEGLLLFTKGELRAFLDGATAGEFDDLLNWPAPRVALGPRPHE